MASFEARLRIVGQPGLPLGVVVDLTRQRMILSANGDVLADWALDDIRIDPHSDGFHIDAEGEQVVLNVNDNSRFETEIRRRNTPG